MEKLNMGIEVILGRIIDQKLQIQSRQEKTPKAKRYRQQKKKKPFYLWSCSREKGEATAGFCLEWGSCPFPPRPSPFFFSDAGEATSFPFPWSLSSAMAAVWGSQATTSFDERMSVMNVHYECLFTGTEILESITKFSAKRRPLAVAARRKVVESHEEGVEMAKEQFRIAAAAGCDLGLQWLQRLDDAEKLKQEIS